MRIGLPMRLMSLHTLPAEGRSEVLPLQSAQRIAGAGGVNDFEIGSKGAGTGQPSLRQQRQETNG
jgi:hypothetical protein